jgi:phosphatidylglycerophosphatase A
MSGYKRNRVPVNIWKNPTHLLACGLGLGAMPMAPGTFGTLLGIPVYLLMQPLPLVSYAGVTLILFLLGIVLCQITARDFGVPDHGAIVWDEVVGYLVTMVAAPAGWLWVVLGFMLFRLFDVLKPWPIGWLDQHVHGGFGIMLDDLLAGVYACCCLQLVVVAWHYY